MYKLKLSSIYVMLTGTSLLRVLVLLNSTCQEGSCLRCLWSTLDLTKQATALPQAIQNCKTAASLPGPVRFKSDDCYLLTSTQIDDRAYKNIRL